VDVNDLVEDWKLMKAELELHLAAFGPPTLLRVHSGGRDTTEETKERVERCILELDGLLRQHAHARE
jgi:hypothetical protein